MVVGGWGTRGVFLGGEEASESSTLTYESKASPSEDSGSQASRYDVARSALEEPEALVPGRASVAGVFCCMRAMKPGMLSLEEGVGCT